MIKNKKMNGKDLTPEQLQGLDAGLTQGGNPSVLNPPKEKKKDTAPKYNPYGTGTANPSNMSTSTGPQLYNIVHYINNVFIFITNRIQDCIRCY